MKYHPITGRQLNDVNETIDVTSYFTKPCHFALQKSSTAVTVKGLIRANGLE